MIFACGTPVQIGAQVIGAVGASGGAIEQDEKVVEAAVAALMESGRSAAAVGERRS